jgi:SAM-dependent methyltransferase
MCSRADIEFGRVVIKEDDVRGKSIIEVGAYDVNGSLRPHVQSLNPGKYVGVDIAAGPGVDLVADVTDILNHFEYGSFDMVIATEVLEHVKNWRKAVSNIKHIIKPGGIVIITVPSKGCGFHGCPEDHWRYEMEDIKMIFSDFIIEELWKSPEIEGVFLKAKRPDNLIEFDTSNYKLFSIMKRRRALDNRGVEILFFNIRMLVRIIRKTPSHIKYLFKGSSICEVATWINHPPLRYPI